MSDSVISMIFLGVLGVLFILLIVLTIVLIATRKKDSGEEESYDADYEELTDHDESYDDANAYSGNYINEEDYEDEQDPDEDYSDEASDADDSYETADEDAGGEAAGADVSGEASVEDVSDEASDEDAGNKDEDSNTTDVLKQNEVNDATENNINEEETANNLSDELGDYSDSAFAPFKEDDSFSNEAIMASVKEAEAMSEALIHGKNISDTEAVFGLSDELASYDKKKPVKRSNVSSNDDFYWYNKLDVAEKPSYKTKEMYYHHFNIPTDCIDDLLVEMYDCALVRTEEIRYIAYGIEPKAVSIKDILSEGNYYYRDQPKKKQPLPQDLIKIYEKWCGYVDKLFDKVEIHADEFTIQEIRRLLYEFGRNDVDVLIEGK